MFFAVRFTSWVLKSLSVWKEKLRVSNITTWNAIKQRFECARLSSGSQKIRFPTFKSDMTWPVSETKSDLFWCDSSRCPAPPFFSWPAIITDLCLSSDTCQLSPPPKAARSDPSCNAACSGFRSPRKTYQEPEEQLLSWTKGSFQQPIIGARSCYDPTPTWIFVQVIHGEIVDNSPSCFWLILLLGNYSWSEKQIGGRYPAFQNPGRGCRSIDWSVTTRGHAVPVLVLPCTWLQMDPWHPSRANAGDGLTSPATTATQKKLSFLTLRCRGGVFCSASSLVSRASESPGCKPRAQPSSQNIHSSAPMYTHAQTHAVLTLWFIHGLPTLLALKSLYLFIFFN